jgi:chorismate mutase
MTQESENLQLIQQHRDQIDILDKQIVSLLNQRALHSLTIRTLKPGANMQLFDAAREDAIYEKVCALNEGPLADENLRAIYATLLTQMRSAPDLK